MAIGGLDDFSISYDRPFRNSNVSPLVGLVRSLQLERQIEGESLASQTKSMRGSVAGHSAQAYLGSGSWSYDSALDAMAPDMRGAVPRDELYRD